MRDMKRHILTTTILSATLLLAAARHADAGTFSLTSGTNTTAQSLTAGGQTGSVSAGATLSVSGASTVGITLSATSGTTTITNSGSILQTATGNNNARAINNTAGTHSIIITNNTGALICAADADVIRGSVAGSNWTINNTGTINSLNPSFGGNHAIDLDAVTTGSVSITNNVGGQILAFAADAIRPGANAATDSKST